MQLVWEINGTTLGIFVVQSVALIVWLVRAYDTAAAAKKKADDSAEDLEGFKRDNDGRHIVNSAAVALIREQFVRKEDLQHLEASIGRQFDSLQKRLDTYFMNKSD